ncbi:MAG: YetF domain-containing protein [Pseudomonadota bacterium]
MFFDQSQIDLIIRGSVLGLAALIFVTLLIRVNGLRSLSKMTNFDFVMTIALGSLLAGAAQATAWSGFIQALIAMVALFIGQWTSARLRKASDTFEDFAQNDPVLLMRNGKMIENAMKETRVTQSDLVAKLREANALDFDQVRAVVLESTGDISVMHGDSIDERLLKDVNTVAS